MKDSIQTLKIISWFVTPTQQPGLITCWKTRSEDRIAQANYYRESKQVSYVVTQQIGDGLQLQENEFNIEMFIMPKIRPKRTLKRELSTWDFGPYIQASPIQTNVLYSTANRRFPGLRKPDQQVKPSTQRNCMMLRESSV